MKSIDLSDQEVVQVAEGAWSPWVLYELLPKAPRVALFESLLSEIDRTGSAKIALQRAYELLDKSFDGARRAASGSPSKGEGASVVEDDPVVGAEYEEAEGRRKRARTLAARGSSDGFFETKYRNSSWRGQGEDYVCEACHGKDSECDVCHSAFCCGICQVNNEFKEYYCRHLFGVGCMGEVGEGQWLFHELFEMCEKLANAEAEEGGYLEEDYEGIAQLIGADAFETAFLKKASEASWSRGSKLAYAMLCEFSGAMIDRGPFPDYQSSPFDVFYLTDGRECVLNAFMLNRICGRLPNPEA